MMYREGIHSFNAKLIRSDALLPGVNTYLVDRVGLDSRVDELLDELAF